MFMALLDDLFYLKALGQAVLAGREVLAARGLAVEALAQRGRHDALTERAAIHFDGLAQPRQAKNEPKSK